MRVLISALACEPNQGSEPEVGYRAVIAAATQHEVWVLTNADTVSSLQEVLKGHPFADRIHIRGVPLHIDRERFARLTVSRFQWYYHRWQRRLADYAVELDRHIDFDVVHHVTLASYWTRAGVASVRKPLIWGPVGGAVEPPVRLLPILGFRGLLEDAMRVPVRRLLAQMPPARQARTRATVTFAQNRDSARRVKGRGPVSVLSNAIVVEPTLTSPPQVRGKTIFFVGRLIPWKAPILALRALGHMDDTDAILHFFGSGPERPRLEIAARRWGLADRVEFEGWLSRDDLLSRLAGAGALVHPALHEEAGLCIGEALALGTPVVCLDHGGPREVVQYWPDVPSAVVPPQTPDITARSMATALDRFLVSPPPVRSQPLRASVSFEKEVLAAYDLASGGPAIRPSRTPTFRGFPRGKPQLFADRSSTLAFGVGSYAFGRRLPYAVQASAAALALLPGVRAGLVQRVDEFEPVCGWLTWEEIISQLHLRMGVRWLYFRSQWEKQRSSALALNGHGTPQLYVWIESANSASFYPAGSATSFHVPESLHSFSHNGWTVRELQPLPSFHRPPRGDLGLVQRITDEIPDFLGPQLARSRDTPSHWRPMHGDFVPWNLRQDKQGKLWLLDWEAVDLGPPLSDLLRYLVAAHSLRRSSVDEAARQLLRSLTQDRQCMVAEAAGYWLSRPGWAGRAAPGDARLRARDLNRSTRELQIFETLQALTQHLPPN